MAQEFKIGRLRYTWRGEWLVAAIYNRDAVVQYNGKTYICLEPHTAQADFYDDLYYITGEGASTPRWLLTIDGRVWKNDWTPNTLYSLGNIVKYGGVVYICTVNHTSGPQELTIENWTTYSSVDKWNSSWTVNTVYGIGDIVKYGGIVYRCTFNHVSAATTAEGLEVNLNYNQQPGNDSTLGAWEVVNDGIDFKGQWSESIRYKRNDVVRNGANLYIATEGHIAVVPFDFQVPDNGIEDSTFSDSTNSKWALWQPGSRNKNTWSTTVVYQIGEIAIYGGYSYRNLISNNVNNIPSSSIQNDSTTVWAIVTQGYNIAGDWRPSQPYEVGDIVYYGGSSYVAIADSTTEAPTAFTTTHFYVEAGSSGTTLKFLDTSGLLPGMTLIAPGFFDGQTIIKVIDSNTLLINQAPNTPITDGAPIEFIGINYTYWQTISPSTKWIGFWNNSSFFVAGDLVIWQNATYRCIKGHDSSGETSLRPDLDTNHALWAVYVYHARENAGNTIGDIITRNIAGENIAVPILPPAPPPVEGEDPIIYPADLTEDYVLKVNDSLLQWQEINLLPDVYYVSPEGIDSPDRGKTTDDPWGSIKYACETIANGTLNPNTYAILKANKEFLVEETYQWMIYQSANEISPFAADSVFDAFSSRRDPRIIIDSLLWDITRGSNSKTVFTALSFFAIESQTTFASTQTAAAQDYIVASLNYLTTIISNILVNDAPAANYQILNYPWTWNVNSTYAIDDVVFLDDVWYISTSNGNTGNSPELLSAWAVTESPAEVLLQDTSLASAETDSTTIIPELMSVIITAVENANTTTIPLPNTGITSTIFIKTGSYFEDLPIVVPTNTALNGDELRGARVFPKDSVYTNAISSSSSNNTITLQSLNNVVVNMPIQFSTDLINDEFGDIVLGQTYYVKEIVDAAQKTITISETVNGNEFILATGVGLLAVYAGNCLKDMFYVTDGTGIRNMTLQGLAGFLGPRNNFETQRPTGGAYVSLAPGLGVDDTSVWILRRSPYIQNVTNFGDGCTGLKISGYLHNGGNKSIVCNDFTQIISDGIGVWCTGPDSLTECVSVFGYYNYAGYFAEDGGRIRATNGNSSYGTYGVIAEGFNVNEVPISATVDNRSSQVQANVQSAFGTDAEILAMQYSNAGSGYYESTTNLLQYSNNFLDGWINDGNVAVQQNVSSPIGSTTGWTLTGTTSNSTDAFVYQDVGVTPTGFSYTALTTLNVSGSGGGATFDVTVGATAYTAVVNGGGTGYVTGNILRVLGSQLGGVDGVNDCFLTVAGLAGSSILTVTVTGTVPTNSSLKYTTSIYVKQGTASSIDIDAIFSGNSSVTSSINYSFGTGSFIGSSANGGFTPVSFSKLPLENGWTRISFTTYDTNALNDNLRIVIWPRGRNAVAGYTLFYGSQLQTSLTPTFYLETKTNTPTAYANFDVTGSGTGVEIVANELRSNAVYTVRLTDTGTGAGGRGYEIASNNAQAGDTTTITLSGSDEGTATQYIGMRAFVQSGTGAGQYGFVSNYDPISKVVHVLKESFPLLDITATETTTNLITVGTATTDRLYINQKIEFIPTYYQSDITDTAYTELVIIATEGGSVNQVELPSTDSLSINMPLRFYGTPMGGLTTGFTYYIKEIVDGTKITISTTLFGPTWQLNTASPAIGEPLVVRVPGFNFQLSGSTASMIPNMPVQFTGTAIGGISVGTQYYVNDVIDENTFSVSSTLVLVDISATTSITNEITYSGTGLIALNPIIFSGDTVGGIDPNTKYYISELVDATTFKITDTLLQTNCSQTQVSSNLITVASTAGFIVDKPIIFTGNTFGGIVNGTVYYILAINDGQSFTISASPGASAVVLSSATGLVSVTTPSDDLVLSDTTQSFAGETTNTKSSISYGFGTMIATYNTRIFGGVSTGVTYYIKTVDSNSTFTISETPGGAAVAVNTRTGSMNLGEAGWNNINPGTQIEGALDNSTVYFIEPRPIFSSPTFTQITGSTNNVSGTWADIAYGNQKFIGISQSGSIIGQTTDGINWSALELPETANWSGIEYGNNYWVIISRDGGGPSMVLYSKSNGAGWRTTTLPSEKGWSALSYGNGIFVAISDDTNGAAAAAYSTDNGLTWNTGSGLPNATWSSISYTAGKWIAVAEGKTFSSVSASGGSGSSVTFNVTAKYGLDYEASIDNPGASYTVADVLTVAGTALGGTSPANDLVITVDSVDAGAITGFTVTSGTANASVGTQSAYSTDGIAWTSTTLPASGAWSGVASGNGLTIATSKSSTTPCYTVDGINWFASPYIIDGGRIAYGQGVFVIMSVSSGTAWTSEQGIIWINNTVADNAYSAIAFGFVGANYNGIFSTISSTSLSSIINAGSTTKGRAVVATNRISSITLWEPGSGYALAPTVSITDPNSSLNATTNVRISNGTLANPSFINKGTGYNTNSTSVIITGGGYAETFQTGTKLIVDNLVRLPGPGDNLIIAGNDTIYKVTSAEVVFGTTAPNIKANLRVSPDITIADSSEHNAAITIRTKYSQARLTGHDFLNVGYGSKLESRYPGVPVDTVLSPQDQAVEINFGRVFYVSTDQDGNFKVGGLFAVEQATGIVTISASQFGLSGLETLSLGGVSIGNASVTIRQFSVDDTFIANSNEIIPTQRAIKSYLEGRLSQGGSNTFTGQLVAGTVLVGGPDKISSTIPNGGQNSVVNMPSNITFDGQFTGWDGDGMALSYFVNSWVR
jgi:hypothetical protein